MVERVKKGGTASVPGERYRRGAHTVLELKYHYVWKTKYSYKVVRGDIGLRLRALIRQICAEKGITVVKGNLRYGMSPKRALRINPMMKSEKMRVDECLRSIFQSDLHPFLFRWL